MVHFTTTIGQILHANFGKLAHADSPKLGKLKFFSIFTRICKFLDMCRFAKKYAVVQWEGCTLQTMYSLDRFLLRLASKISLCIVGNPTNVNVLCHRCQFIKADLHVLAGTDSSENDKALSANYCTIRIPFVYEK